MPRAPRDFPEPWQPEPAADLPGAMDAFRQRLQIAAEYFATDPARGKKMAIDSVILLLRGDLGFHGDMIKPFSALRDDIVDGARGPAGLPRAGWRHRVEAAARLHAMVLRGEAEEPSAKKIAAILDRHGIKISRKKRKGLPIPTWESVCELRKDLLARKGPPAMVTLFASWSVVFDNELDPLEHFAGRMSVP